MAKTPDLNALLRADQARTADLARRNPRRGNNPYSAPVEPERRTYADPTADQAIANVDRALRREIRDEARKLATPPSRRK